MPATVSTRGVLKASQNRVRTSVTLQGSGMWENVIGIVNEERGANAGVEALINAPEHKGGRQANKQARKAAAAEAVLATGGFDTAITDYESLLNLAKSQGAVGTGNRGACKVCGQLGHLTKQCRNQFSKFYKPLAGTDAAAAAAGGAAAGASGAAAGQDYDTDSGLSSNSNDSDSRNSSPSSSDSEAERRRRRRDRKDKKRRRERKERKDKKRRRKEKSRSKDKDSKKRSEKRRRRSRSRSRD